jgi:hypothetical protein
MAVFTLHLAEITSSPGNFHEEEICRPSLARTSLQRSSFCASPHWTRPPGPLTKDGIINEG